MMPDDPRYLVDIFAGADRGDSVGGPVRVAGACAVTDWFRSQIDSSTATLTRDSLQRAIDSVQNAAMQPTVIVTSAPVYRLYDFMLRRFNIWASYSPRLVVPAWLPHIAWSRPVKWARRKYRRWQWARRDDE